MSGNDQASGRVLIRVMPGECRVGSGNQVFSTLLGSCIAACLREPEHGVGGMNHFLLPSGDASGNAAVGAAEQPLRYGLQAMDALIEGIRRETSRRAALEAKVFGGARMISASTEVGFANARFVLEYLQQLGIDVVAHDLGGHQPRVVEYTPRTGRARIRRIEMPMRRDPAEVAYVNAVDDKIRKIGEQAGDRS